MAGVVGSEEGGRLSPVRGSSWKKTCLIKINLNFLCSYIPANWVPFNSQSKYGQVEGL